MSVSPGCVAQYKVFRKKAGREVGIRAGGAQLQVFQLLRRRDQRFGKRSDHGIRVGCTCGRQFGSRNEYKLRALRSCADRILVFFRKIS